MAEEVGESTVGLERLELSSDMDGGRIGSVRLGDGRTRSGKGSMTSSDIVIDWKGKMSS